MLISAISELSTARQTDPITHVGTADTSPASGATDASVASFGDVFGALVDTANRADARAGEKIDALASGAGDDIHGTMISVKEADISVKLVASIRTKLLDAFNEIWKTSV